MKTLQKHRLIILIAILAILLCATALIVLFQPSDVAYAAEIRDETLPESKMIQTIKEDNSAVAASEQFPDLDVLVSMQGYCGHNPDGQTNYTVKQYEPYTGVYLKDSIVNLPGYCVFLRKSGDTSDKVLHYQDYYLPDEGVVHNNINYAPIGTYELIVYANPMVEYSDLKRHDDDYSGDLGCGIPNNQKIGLGTLFIRENSVIQGEETKGNWVTVIRDLATACDENNPYTHTITINNEASLEICIAYELQEKKFLLYDLHNIIETYKINFVKESFDLQCTDSERTTGLIFKRPLILTNESTPMNVTTAGFKIVNPGHEWDRTIVLKDGNEIPFQRNHAYTEKGCYEISTQGRTQTIYVIDSNFFQKNIVISFSGIVRNNIHYYDTDQLKNEQIFITYLKQNDPYAPQLGIKIGDTESSFGQTISGVGSYNITIHGMGNLSSESLLTYKMTLKIQNYDARSNYRAMRTRQHATNYPSEFYGVRWTDTFYFVCPDEETASALAEQLEVSYEFINVDYDSGITYFYVGFDDTYAPEIPSLNDYKFAFNDGVESVTVNYKRLGEVTQYKNFQYGVSVNDQITESGIYEIHETDAFGNLGVYYAYYAKENLSKIKLTTNYAGIETTLEIGENYNFPAAFVAESFSLWNLRYAIDGYDVDPGAQVIVIKDDVREIYTAEDLNVENAEDLLVFSEEGLYTIRFVDRCHNQFQFNVRIPGSEYKLEYTGTTQFEIQSDLKIYIDKSAQDVSIQINMVEQTDLTFVEDDFYRTVVIPRSTEQKFVIIKYRSPATGETVTVNAIILAEVV